MIYLTNPRKREVDAEGASELVPVKPSSRECRICFVHNAVPFIGFGFLDNVVMIVAGDYIDSTLGVAFNISGTFFRYIDNLSIPK